MTRNKYDISCSSKICPSCNAEKPSEDFFKCSSFKDGLRRKCKKCEFNLLGITVPNSKNCATCKLTHPSDMFRRFRNSEDGLNPNCKICCKNPHRKRNNEKARITQKTWYHKTITPEIRLRKATSKAIRCALKRVGASKHGDSCLKYLPYSLDELKKHIESLWESWMNWENYGKYDSARKTWQIDHIMPQSLLPYSSMTEANFQKCWELTNLQPLETIANMKKSDRIP